MTLTDPQKELLAEALDERAASQAADLSIGLIKPDVHDQEVLEIAAIRADLGLTACTQKEHEEMVNYFVDMYEKV